MTRKANHETPSSGKVENGANKTGNQKPTQRNEGRRTPQSRNDRESDIGGGNQNHSRKGPIGMGH